MRGLLPGLSLETVEQAGQVEMHTAQIPGEGRRRSPSQSSQFRSDEHATRMHQFLDSERSEVPPADVAKALLSDWVPGVSGRTEGNAGHTVPSALGGVPLTSLEGPQGGRKSTRKTIWLAASLSLVALVGFSSLALSWRKSATTGPSLQALGEGETREDFVRVDGTQFMLDCRPFYVAGFNAHDLVPKALAIPSEHKTFEGRTGKQLVQEMLSNASSIGLNVVRLYAHTTDPEHPILVRPGKYNDDALEAMDFIMETARQLGMKVMLSFADNWKLEGGVDQMLEWSKTVKKRSQKRPAEQDGDFDDMVLPENVKEYEVARHSLFFNDTGARSIYKEYVRAIVTRQNSMNGRLYSHDPTLMAWGLLNEPRCETWLVPECKETFQAWVEEMSAFVKSLDGTHLVSIGAEGFFGENSLQAKSNPQTWGGQIGQDFTENHRPSTIDFLTTHVWPDNWQRTERAYQEEWLNAHMDLAKSVLKKPLLLEEFGKKLVMGSDTVLFEQAIDRLRNPVFDNTYQMVLAALERHQPLQGSLFWRWDLMVYENQPRADYGVRLYDTTFNLIRSHARDVARLQASTPPAAQCGLQCWVPSQNTQSCKNSPSDCSGKTIFQKASTVPTYPTKTACCRPGLGAFLTGCSE